MSTAVMNSSAMHSPFPQQYPSPVASKRSSISTSKSTLRASNTALIDMLQNIQAELYAHRSIMLDIQSRVSHLEKSRPVSGISSCTGTDMRARERERLDAHNKLIAIAPEGQAWWEACQNFARNSNPPISAGEFLRTPVPVSAFEPAWNNRFSGHMSILETPPITPPEQKSSVQIVVDEVATTPTEKTKTVEIEVKELPPPPPLRPAPRPGSDSPSVETTDFAGATSTKKAESEQTRPAKKRKRSLATFEARFKHNKLDKEHIVLIQFHKASDMQEES